MDRSAREYQLAVADHGIDPAILMEAINTFTEKKPKGGVRDIARQIEDQIADGLIEAKASNARRIRFEADGKRVRVIPIDDDETQQQAKTARSKQAAAS